MSTSDPDRISQLEHRVAALENQLAARPSRVAPPSPASGWGQPATLRAPAATPPTSASPVTTPPARPSAPAPIASAAASASRSFADLEEQLSSRLLAWVGGLALVLGAMFFLSLAFSRGWIGPEARVLVGLLVGAASLFAGAWLFERGDRTPAMVLAGVGVGTGSLALFAASRLYGFIPVETALVGFLVLAVGTAAIALRGNSQAVAAFGIVATTAAPPIVGASPTLVTVAFLGAALAGTAMISFGRSWPWLALLAFLMSAPQAANWFATERTMVLAIAGIGLFWTINALAASGSALAGLRPTTVHRASATLLVLNALFAIGSIHAVLPGDPFARSVALLILAGLHGALALPLLFPPRRRRPFGDLAAGVAVGTLAIGIALELGGIAAPIAHTVLATVVAWVAVRFRERAPGAWAAAVGSLAILHFVTFEYPLGALARTGPQGWPFASSEAIVAIVIAAAMLVTGVVAWRSFRAVPLRSPLLTASLTLAGGGLGEIAVFAYASQFELRADLRIVAWAILAVTSFAIAAVVRRDRPAWLAAAFEGAALISTGTLLALADVAPLGRLLVDPARGTDVVPLFNLESLALGALAVALGVAGWVVARWTPKHLFGPGNNPWAAGASAAAGAVAVYLVSIAIVDAFQTRIGAGAAPDEIATQAQVALSIAWVVIGAGAFAAGLVRGMGRARLFGLGLLAVATAKVFLFDLAALDVSYRVLSFVGLGAVLLASSFVAAHFRAPGGSSPADPS
jgi:uncharacterized membrane protein